jgi:hypothetical protein
MASKTLCPECGFSPIPENASACPKCHEPFDFLATHKKAQRNIRNRLKEQGEATATRHGAVGSAVAAFPLSGVVCLFSGAAVWAVRALPGTALGGASVLLWALAGVMALDALALWTNTGPSVLVARLAFLVSAAVAVITAVTDPHPGSPVHAATLFHVAAGLAAVWGEPSSFRRRLTAGSCALGAAAVVALVLARAPHSGGPTRMLGTAARWQLPEGFTYVEPIQLSPLLTAPSADKYERLAANRLSPERTAALLLLARREGAQLLGGCEELVRHLGTRSSAPTSAPPRSLGANAIVLPFTPGPGAAGRVACTLLPEGRWLALVVAAATDAVAQSALDSLAFSLTLDPASQPR